MARPRVNSVDAKMHSLMLEPEDSERLKRLAKTREQSQGKTVATGLKLLETAMRYKAKGGEILFVDADGMRKLHMEDMLKKMTCDRR